MTSEIIGQGFQEFRGALRDEAFGFPIQLRVVDRTRNGVFDVAKIARRPESDIKNQALAPAAFSARNADLGKFLELINVDLLFGGNSHFVEGLILWESTF